MKNPLRWLGRALKRHGTLIALDLNIVALSFYLALPMRFAGAPPEGYTQALQRMLPLMVCVYVAANLALGLYHRLWKYASAQEVLSIAAAVIMSTGVVLIYDLYWQEGLLLPLSTVLLGGFFSFAGFTAVRYRGRLLTGLSYRWRRVLGAGDAAGAPRRLNVLVVGAGEGGQHLVRRFREHRQGQRYRIVGFVDDDPVKHGMGVHGVKVLGDRHVIPSVVAKASVDLIIIAIYRISGEDFQAVLDICEQTSARIKIVPNMFDVIGGTIGQAPIRDITAEDLLGRQAVKIDRAACERVLTGKVVLVTGAAGSIGSELCRQIVTFLPKRLVMIDNNESGLHDTVIQLQGIAHDDGGARVVPMLSDITSTEKMRRVFDMHRPQIVFHAAAYKHVPIMEDQPDEAVRVNLGGTQVVANLAVRYGIERFVVVSTDKAVNPSSVMGATKRVWELLIMSDHRTAPRADDEVAPAAQSWPLFTAVRFGNVLGSRGSVVPTFERQIEQGGPVTITHREMTRYFMSVSEAASLIIQAAALTTGGDLFMLDMGQRIRIDDLARRLIRLRGLRPEHDIPIEFTGMRAGEKMHEELIGEGESSSTTSHPHVFRILSRDLPTRGPIECEMIELIRLAELQHNDEIVRRLRLLVGDHRFVER